MNHKIVIPVLLGLLVVFVTSPVFAKDVNIQRNQEKKEIKQEIKTKFNQVKVEALYQKILLNFTAKRTYQDQVKTRLEKRIEEKTAAGKNVIEIKAKLTGYATTIDAYTKALEAFNKKYQEIILLEKPATKIGELKAAAKEVQTSLNDGRKILIDTARLLLTLK